MAAGMTPDVRRWWVRFAPVVLLTAAVVWPVGVLAPRVLLDFHAGLESGRQPLSPVEIEAYRSCEAFVRRRVPALSAAKFPPAAHPDVRISRVIIEWVPFTETPVLRPGTRTAAAAEDDRRRLDEYWSDRSGQYYHVESFVVTPDDTDTVVRSRVECQVRWPGPGQRWRLLDLQIGASGAIAVSR